MSSVDVSPVNDAVAELLPPLAALLPQLSKSAGLFTLDRLEAIIENDATELLLARIDGAIVGMLTVACFPTPSGVRAWIEDVVADEGARGYGVGTALVRAALEQARARGARTVELTSRPSRVAADHLYLGLGFIKRESNVYRLTLD